MSGTPVLMYHALEDAGHPSGSGDPGELLYQLSADEFRQHLEFLKREGYHSVLLDELIHGGAQVSQKAVVLTFDDGHDSNYHLALPILKEFGFRAEFFVTTDWIGTPHYLSAGQLRALEEAGMGVGSHGASHRFLSDLSLQEQELELMQSKRVLGEILERPVRYLSAPGGRCDVVTAELAHACGYRGCCTSRPYLFRGLGRQRTIDRFAMRGGSLGLLKDLVARRRSTLFRAGFSYQLLHLAKRLLGNGGYQRLRGLLLGAPAGTGQAERQDSDKAQVR